MSKLHMHMQAGVLAFILLPAAVGVLTIHASPVCERFVRTYVTTPVRNRVSKTTAQAWAAWRIGHPNWKPNPNRHRPKYTMNRKEALKKIEFACGVPTVPSTIDMLFTPADFEGAPPIIELPPMEATEITFEGYIPPEVAEIPPYEATPFMPGNSFPPLAPFIPPGLQSPPTGGGTIFPPVPPPIDTPVPEPSSFALVALGMGASLFFWMGRLRNVAQGLASARP